MISIQVSDSDAVLGSTNPATNTEDYDIGNGDDTFTVTFFPNDQRLNIDFELLPDEIPEGNEAFVVSSFRLDSLVLDNSTVLTLPDFSPPTFALTFVNIMDNDCEFIV